MVLSDHTGINICIYSLLVHQVLDRVLSDLALVYNILISKLACGINYLYIKHNERYNFYQSYSHCLLQIFMD